MNKKLVLVFLLGAIVFFAGCVEEKPKELQFKNDVVTIENYFVSNVAPYEKGGTNIQFEIHNNGDQKIPYVEVDFFDVPGFSVDSIDCPIGDKPAGENKCVYKDGNDLKPLDIRSITIQIKSNEDISSPTPHTVSFAVGYTYFGSRDISIPVIDGETRKQPLTKLRQSEPSTGPVALDMDPSIEREIVAADKTIKESWAIGGRNPLSFLTKFKFRHVGSLEKVKDVNIPAGNIVLSVNGLSIENPCDFGKDFGKFEVQLESGSNEIIYKGPTQSVEDATESISSFLDTIMHYDSSKTNVPVEDRWLMFIPQAPADVNNLLTLVYGEKYTVKVTQDVVWGSPHYSTKSVLVPFDTLICTFKPNINQPEYSAMISAGFTYKYEFIKSQDFVVQPLPE